MMYITPTRLADFKKRYKRQYGREIDDEKAYEMASNLVGLYRTVYLTTDQKAKVTLKTDDESNPDS